MQIAPHILSVRTFFGVTAFRASAGDALVACCIKITSAHLMPAGIAFLRFNFSPTHPGSDLGSVSRRRGSKKSGIHHQM